MHSHHLSARLARDGGAASSSIMAMRRRSRDTLQAVRAHAAADLLARRRADLPAHVDFAALARAASACAVSRVVTQGSWLETLGIGPRASALAARNPERTQAIASARRRLCAEDQMGRLFKVIALRHPQWPAMAGTEP